MDQAYYFYLYHRIYVGIHIAEFESGKPDTREENSTLGKPAQSTYKESKPVGAAIVSSDDDRCELHLLRRTIALISLLIISPFLGVLYVLVKLDSKGSFIYRQQRPGYLGALFATYKIRTMTEGADQNPMLARAVLPSTPEVTRIGRCLRGLKIDELPQLWNIVRGEMAWVGPRPIAASLQKYLETMIPGFGTRWTVLPGLTNLGQVCINENDCIERVVDDWAIRYEAERHYMIHQSNVYDLVIISMTIGYCVRKLLKVLRSAMTPLYVMLLIVFVALCLSGCAERFSTDGFQQLDNTRMRPIPWNESVGNNPVLTVESVSVATFPRGEADTLYRLGPKDRIFINVFGEPGLDDIVVQVDGAGDVQLPILERVNVANLSLSELQALLKVAYGKHFLDPWIVVELVESLSRPVYLLGKFNQPGIIHMIRATSVLQALGEGHGLAEGAYTRGARLIRDEKIVAIDLHALLNRGRMNQNIWLMPHDTIFVPGTDDLRIFVLGAVIRPGAQEISNSSLTLAEAIAHSGGERRGQANLKDVRVIRTYSPVSGALYIVDFSRIIAGLATDMRLQPGDIVYVPVNKIGGWNEVIEAISPTILMFSRALDPFLTADALTTK